MAFQILALFLALLRPEDGRVSLFNSTNMLGVAEVSNITPTNLAREELSYWFNLLVIQKIQEPEFGETLGYRCL